MKIYSALQIGDYHVNHCEDYLFTGEIGNNKVLCAVMDGCSTAIDSYLISTITGKLLRKISKGIGYREMYDLSLQKESINSYLKIVLKELFKELNGVKNQLMLEKKELLTTLIILLIDKKENKGAYLVIGDGFVSINGDYSDYDQDNKPDYLGFHLSEDFESWYKAQHQKKSFDRLSDITIATDRIFMFEKVSKVSYSEEIDPIQFLVVDKTNAASEEMLASKLKILEREYGLKPTDDLGMVRIIF